MMNTVAPCAGIAANQLDRPTCYPVEHSGIRSGGVGRTDKESKQNAIEAIIAMVNDLSYSFSKIHCQIGWDWKIRTWSR